MNSRKFTRSKPNSEYKGDLSLNVVEEHRLRELSQVLAEIMVRKNKFLFQSYLCI